MFDIICIGSGTVDVFVDTKRKQFHKVGDHEDVCYHVGGKQLVNSLFTSTGGGGTNTAVSFSRLGMKTGWLGVAGKDLHGEHLLNVLKHEKVKSLGPVKKGQSGYSVILVGLHKDRSILAYKGVNNDLVKKDVALSKLKTKKVYLSSLMGKSFATAKQLIPYFKKKRIHWAFNPSSYLARKGVGSLKSMINGCCLLVCNLEEAQLLFKTKTRNVETLLDKMIEAEAYNAVITDGPRGAYGCDSEQYFTLKARKDKVVDSTGAGDAFASACFAFLDKGLAKAMQCGYAQSTAVIAQVGAKTGLLSKGKLLSLVKKQNIKVHKKPRK